MIIAKRYENIAIFPYRYTIGRCVRDRLVRGLLSYARGVNDGEPYASMGVPMQLCLTEGRQRNGTCPLTGTSAASDFQRSSPGSDVPRLVTLAALRR